MGDHWDKRANRWADVAAARDIFARRSHRWESRRPDHAGVGWGVDGPSGDLGWPGLLVHRPLRGAYCKAPAQGLTLGE